MNTEEVMVSVCMVCFNQEKYIKQAVDAVLNQKTNFGYEVFVSDDASTDGTAQILRDNYKDDSRVKLILRKENARGKNGYSIRQKARGKYICLCEGDDYWVGTDVLQCFVDWLESNPEYVGIAGRRINLSERTGRKSVNYKKSECGCRLTLNDFMDGKLFDLHACLFRNFYQDGKYDYRTWKMHRYVGDLTNSIYVLLHGDIYRSDKIIGVYRCDRFKGTSSYNAVRTAKDIYIDHMDLVHNLEKKLPAHLDYTQTKCRYTTAYLNSLFSIAEWLKALPVVLAHSGLAVTAESIKNVVKS